MAKPEDKEQNLTLADINPSLLLNGNTPRLIDEWQTAPKLWDAVRFEIDHRNLEGQFILTGSAVPVNMDEVTHTGTGRFTWLLMRPMSLYESGELNGNISLEMLFQENDNITGTNNLSLQDIAYLCCRGGWPRSTFMDKDIALEQAFDYYDAIVQSDISRVEIVNDSFSLDTDTILSYINALKKIFVVEEAPAWNPNLRSKTTIRTADTRYFIDPSIATAALGLGPNDLIGDLNTFGLIFETLCIRDLRIYAESINGSVYHYRDANDLECDAVIHLRNGLYGLIEIKLGGDKLINEGAENLKKMYSKTDITKMKNSSFLMVLTATGNYAYKREDGVYVVPIGCLKN